MRARTSIVLVAALGCVDARTRLDGGPSVDAAPDAGEARDAAAPEDAAEVPPGCDPTGVYELRGTTVLTPCGPFPELERLTITRFSRSRWGIATDDEAAWSITAVDPDACSFSARRVDLLLDDGREVVRTLTATVVGQGLTATLADAVSSPRGPVCAGTFALGGGRLDQAAPTRAATLEPCPPFACAGARCVLEHAPGCERRFCARERDFPDTDGLDGKSFCTQPCDELNPCALDASCVEFDVVLGETTHRRFCAPRRRICGNGEVETASPRWKGEICDDGNRRSGDGCAADCRSDERCGDEFVGLGETCDPGPWEWLPCDAATCTLTLPPGVALALPPGVSSAGLAMRTRDAIAVGVLGDPIEPALRGIELSRLAPGQAPAPLGRIPLPLARPVVADLVALGDHVHAALTDEVAELDGFYVVELDGDRLGELRFVSLGARLVGPDALRLLARPEGLLVVVPTLAELRVFLAPPTGPVRELARLATGIERFDCALPTIWRRLPHRPGVGLFATADGPLLTASVECGLHTRFLTARLDDPAPALREAIAGDLADLAFLVDERGAPRLCVADGPRPATYRCGGLDADGRAALADTGVAVGAFPPMKAFATDGAGGLLVADRHRDVVGILPRVVHLGAAAESLPIEELRGAAVDTMGFLGGRLVIVVRDQLTTATLDLAPLRLGPRAPLVEATRGIEGSVRHEVWLSTGPGFGAVLWRLDERHRGGTLLTTTFAD